MTSVGPDPFEPGQLAPARHHLSHAVRAGTYPVCPQALVDLVNAEDQLLAESERLMHRGVETFGQHLQRVTADLVAGKPLPEDFTLAAASTVAGEEEAKYEMMAVRTVQEAIAERWSIAAREHVDEMLLGLRAELGPLMAEIHAAAVALGDLDPTDPEAVAEASGEQQRALTALKALRPRYRRLRKLQQQLVETAVERPWNRGGTDATVWPWATFWETRVHEFSGIPKHGAPHTDSRSMLWYRALIHRRDVWLPTLPELQDAWAEIRHQVRPGPHREAQQ